MGAIQKNGFTFDIEYSEMLQKGAVHVFQNGEFVHEMPFTFQGQDPDPQEIERLVDTFFD